MISLLVSLLIDASENHINVSKDGNTERCWHPWENFPLRRVTLVEHIFLRNSAAHEREIILQSCSLLRLSGSTCAILFSNTSNTSLPFAYALSPGMLARSLS